MFQLSPSHLQICLKQFVNLFIYIPPKRPLLHGLLGYKCHNYTPSLRALQYMSHIYLSKATGYCMVTNKNAHSPASMDTLCMENWSCTELKNVYLTAKCLGRYGRHDEYMNCHEK